jgi:cytochrome subunit of sulfide dehydrogenase
MRIQLALAALLCVPFAAAAQGADSNLGRNLAASCAGCHNITGKSLTGMPGIAGRTKESLAGTLKDYKEGKRPATVMHQLAKGYTDEQIELIAAYFAAQK